MEITARELRDVEIGEAFRGYHREVVNDLLERAASTVESGEQKMQELTDRLQAAQLEAARGRETEDILHKTLLHAERAADETVAEAQEKARVMMEEAELESHKLVADAKSEAQRYGEDERNRLEDEVVDLSARRDTLLADVDALTRYESDYRQRVADAIEKDLDAVRNGTMTAPGPVPEISSVELPAAREGFAATAASTQGASDAGPTEDWYSPSVAGTDLGTPVAVAEDNGAGPDDPAGDTEVDEGTGAKTVAATSFFAPSEAPRESATSYEAPSVASFDTDIPTGSVVEPTAFVDAAAEPAAAPENGARDNGAHDNGAHDNGAHDNGAHDNGAHDNGESGDDEPTRKVDVTALFDAEAVESEEAADTFGSGSAPAFGHDQDFAMAEAPRRDSTFDSLTPAALEADVLDDDAFFATLREAATDETPLGPREGNDDVPRYGTEDERGSFRDVFRRRR